MQHNVTPAVLDLISGLKATQPRLRHDGLWMVALDGHRRAGGPAELHGTAGIELLEVEPPVADRIIVVNRTDRTAIAYPGDAMSGGLADRVVAAVAVIPPGARGSLRVEATEARWWPGGPLVPGPSVDPLISAGIELLRHGGAPGTEAMTRTALWAAKAGFGFGPRPSMHTEAPPMDVRGWAIGDDAGLIGANVYRRTRALPRVPAGGAVADARRRRPDAAGIVQTVLGQVAALARRGTPEAGVAPMGDLRLRLMVVGGDVLGLSLVRATPEVLALLSRTAA